MCCAIFLVFVCIRDWSSSLILAVGQALGASVLDGEVCVGPHHLTAGLAESVRPCLNTGITPVHILIVRQGFLLYSCW